jgi:hypothetical protein
MIMFGHLATFTAGTWPDLAHGGRPVSKAPVYVKTDCAAEIQRIARELFNFNTRTWGMRKKEQK